MPQLTASRRVRVALFTLPVFAVGACTHWSANEVYGERRELARRDIGGPQIAETSSSSMSAGFLGASQDDGRGTTVSSASLSGSSGSLKRTHCIQEAEIDYVQPYDVVYEESGRPLDVTGGAIVGLLGLVTLGAAANGAEAFGEPGDPFYEPGDNQTGVYVAGGVLLAAGLAWIIGSYAALPSGPRPAPVAKEKRWTDKTFVETTGCGLVPADRGPPSNPSPGDDDVESRLRRLDDLRRRGLISEGEYERKRREILDTL